MALSGSAMTPDDASEVAISLSSRYPDPSISVRSNATRKRRRRSASSPPCQASAYNIMAASSKVALVDGDGIELSLDSN